VANKPTPGQTAVVFCYVNRGCADTTAIVADPGVLAFNYILIRAVAGGQKRPRPARFWKPGKSAPVRCEFDLDLEHLCQGVV